MPRPMVPAPRTAMVSIFWMAVIVRNLSLGESPAPAGAAAGGAHPLSRTGKLAFGSDTCAPSSPAPPAPAIFPRSSGNRNAVDAGRLRGQVAQLVGDGQGVAGRGGDLFLELRGGGVLFQDLAP